jgi:hypothetical protein
MVTVASAKAFNSNKYPYLEMEIHGPVVHLQPGESFEIEERQKLFDIPTLPVTEQQVRRYL